MSQPTSLSLLERLRDEPQTTDWRRFMEVYEPLLRSWLRRNAIINDDSDDLVQNIMAVVVRRLAEFDHNGRPGAFRTWLRTITFNCVKEHWRGRKGQPKAAGEVTLRRCSRSSRIQKVSYPAFGTRNMTGTSCAGCWRI